MKKLILLPLVLLLANQVCSQSLALPRAATDVSSVPPLVIPSISVFIQEGGNIPSNPSFTCDGEESQSFKSTAGYSLTHYFEGGKETLKQTLQAYKSIGGFASEIKADYDNVSEEKTPGFIRKSPMTANGNVVYYTVTLSCIEGKNQTSTQLYYSVRISDDSNFGTVQVIIFDSTIDKAKGYADEIIARLRKLEYSKMN